MKAEERYRYKISGRVPFINPDFRAAIEEILEYIDKLEDKISIYEEAEKGQRNDKHS